MDGRRPRPWDATQQPTSNPFTLRRPEKKPYILSVSERETLLLEKRELESSLRESDEWGKGTRASVDKAYIKRQIDKIDGALFEGRARQISSGNKDKVRQMADELAIQIQIGMPTYDEMWAPEKHPGAVRKQHMWEKKNAKKIERWKFLRRQMEPEDPTISNVELLRQK